MKSLNGYVFPILLAFWVRSGANADPIYKYSVVPDKELITINEGQRDVEHYTMTNLGNEPIWVFKFSVSASHPILPDPTDRAGAHYFGPDASLGVEVDPGGTFKFGYELFTPKEDPHPEFKDDPDFGLRTFIPNIAMQLRKVDLITSPFLPRDSGTVTAFDVKVVDPQAPEPGTGILAGSVFAMLAMVRIALRLGRRALLSRVRA